MHNMHDFIWIFKEWLQRTETGDGVAHRQLGIVGLSEGQHRTEHGAFAIVVDRVVDRVVDHCLNQGADLHALHQQIKTLYNERAT
ncbi:hypothetical protein [Arthrobacter psychrochitiniphilus]|uniref:hypothetical protein n=1 Tax=Arthrobacter psychrochitiniphilus TaxID=291045 RepID=UPI0011B41746|nr:hypothetical protein [Arthrobacter psychrochitiniphilus]NYG18318.1 hypothetical protein [Arthrobacter psychrochitiniphilus]